MNGLYDSMIADIAADRHLSVAQTRTAIESTPYPAQHAIDLHLIDKLGRPEEAEHEALSRAHLEQTGLMDFDDYHPTARSSGPVIAVVQGEGDIVSGPEQHSFFNSDANMNGDVISRALLDASNDPNVKAIVFRVSSPGGSVVASDQILSALRTAKARGKHIVVSMGELAASGGYYVSAEADEIVAEPTTITGSIGVLGGKLIIGPAMDYYLSSHTDRLTVGSPYVTMFSQNTPFSPQERAAFSGFIDRAYHDFVQLVANGRHMSFDQAHALAHGRVWTGQQAMDRHLVDHLGGFDVAVSRAKALAGISDATEVSLRMYPRVKNPFQALSNLFGVSADDAEALARLDTVIRDPRVARVLAAIPEQDANVRARADTVEVR
jgi:protease-4